MYYTDGSGTVQGLDISEKMIDYSTKRLHNEILSGKLQIHLGSVLDMPFNNAIFDRIFHCNCYYFWPDHNLAARELSRVMKPGGVMVTAVQWEWAKYLHQKGFMQGGNVVEPDQFMKILERNGFENIYVKKCCAQWNRSFYAYFATRSTEENP